MATVGAYVLCRLKHPTHIDETATGRLCPLKLAEWLTTVEPALPLLETAMARGATERVAARLLAVRLPAALVHERRRVARKNAQQKGDTPSQAHLTRMAWNRFLTRVKVLQDSFGQMLPCELHTARQLWKELRRSAGSAEDMLRFLARHCKRSLLGDYACLRPAP